MSEYKTAKLVFCVEVDPFGAAKVHLEIPLKGYLDVEHDNEADKKSVNLIHDLALETVQMLRGDT